MNDEYILLLRSMLDDPIICKDADHLAVWVWILLNARHEERDVLFKGERVKLHDGEVLTSQKKMSEELKIDRTKIGRILKIFKSEHLSEHRTDSQNTLISVLNWERHQKSEHQIEHQMNTKRTPNEHPADTSRVDADALFEKLWKLYPVKRGKSYVTPEQKQKLLEIGFDEMKRSIERYISEWEKDKEWRKLQNGSTFFNNGYMDYLDDNFEPSNRRSNNRFNDYPQREYTNEEMKKLECALTKRGRKDG